MFGDNLNILILSIFILALHYKKRTQEKKGKNKQYISLITIKQFSEAPMGKVI